VGRIVIGAAERAAQGAGRNAIRPQRQRLSGPPVVGQLGQFRRRPLELLDRCALTPGPVVGLRIRTPAYVLKTAEDLRHVIVSGAAAYEKSSRVVGSRAQRAGGRGVIFRPSGAAHGRARAMLQPSFGRRAVASVAGEMVRSVDRALESWPSETPIDLGGEATRLSFRTMLRGVFGTAPEEAPELVEGIALRRRFVERSVRALLPRPRFVPVTLKPSDRRRLARLDSSVDDLIRRQRSLDAPPTSLLAELAALQVESDGTAEPDDAELRSQLLTIGMTGYLTVAMALTWALYELARNPHHAARMEAEVADALAGEPPTADALDGLPYTAMVVSESLRLYPPSWLFMRTVRADDELPSGATLPAGAKVLISPYLVHRSPAYYEQPERFDPERFVSEAVAGRPRFAYLPFGGGRRVCVGREFALVQLNLALARLVQRARFELVSDAAELDPHIVLRPRDPIRVRVARR
jgi:cytochrome P450